MTPPQKKDPVKVLKERKRKEAYKLVLADLKKNCQCEDTDYCIGCYSCGLRLVYKTLKSHLEFEDTLG